VFPSKYELNFCIFTRNSFLKAHVEAVTSISTLPLRVVGGDEKEPSVRGYNWATLFLGDINTVTWPSR
jgi:hypothetical protein